MLVECSWRVGSVCVPGCAAMARGVPLFGAGFAPWTRLHHLLSCGPGEALAGPHHKASQEPQGSASFASKPCIAG